VKRSNVSIHARGPFIFDAQTLVSNEILTLTTSAGDLDLLATVKGIGPYSDVEALSGVLRFEDLDIRVLGIDGLIRSKRAAERPKDETGLIELEALLEAQRIAGEQDLP
jgi:hypothetical protein